MEQKSFFLIDTYKSIKNKLPSYVLSLVKKLAPIYILSSLFEIFGLVIIFPVIKVILEPSYIHSNSVINFLYQNLEFKDTISFSLFLFSSITLIFIIKNLILFFISKQQTKVAFSIANRLSLEKYNTYLNKSYRFHTENNTAVLLRNITQLPFELINYIILPFIAIINEFFILILIISGILYYNPMLFISLIVFTAPFLVIYNKVYKKKLKNISIKRDKESANMFKSALQAMESYREIVVFNKLNYFSPIFERTLGNYSQSQSEAYLLNIFSPKIVEMVAILGIFSIFISGYIFNRDISLIAQFLIVFSIAAYRVIPSLNKIILSSNYIKSSFYVFQYFDKSEDQSVIETNTDISGSKSIDFNNNLEIRNLSFNYIEGNLVLKSINLEIKKGQIVGIVGPSGGGKTTLLNILLRLYEETAGGIYVDGIKIEKSNLHLWYRLVSYVPQNIILLDGSIIENIAFGIPLNQVDSHLLKKVIEQAQLENFVNSLTEGTNTEIGEKGIKISGGQRQRIGIARALYHGGEILIFDEATSSLDTETETMVTESINNISHQDLTIIIVAHRIQTLKYCDAIYKLENGEINSKPMIYTEIKDNQIIN